MLVFAGLNAQAYACPMAMYAAVPGSDLVQRGAAVKPAKAEPGTGSCHETAEAEASASHQPDASPDVGKAAKTNLAACCGPACAPAVPSSQAHTEPTAPAAPASHGTMLSAALADALLALEKPPPRAGA
jgi:hypothetical protein